MRVCAYRLSHLFLSSRVIQTRSCERKAALTKNTNRVSDGNFLCVCVLVPYAFRLSEFFFFILSFSDGERRRHRPRERAVPSADREREASPVAPSVLFTIFLKRNSRGFASFFFFVLLGPKMTCCEQILHQMAIREMPN